RGRLRGAPLRLRGRDRRRARQPARRHGGEPPRRPPRQLRQGPLPRAVVLHALRAHGADPGAPAHGALRPRLMGRRALVACVVCLMAAVGPLLPAYPLTLLTQALIAAILAMSLDLLLGYTGLPSLGHAAYFGVGAYAVAILATERQVGFAGCLAAGLVAAAVTAALFGLLAIRATGTYFLMITLALGMVVWGLAFRWVSLTKGDNGIAGVPRPELPLPWSLSAPLPFFYFALVAAALAWAALGTLAIAFLKNFVSVYTKRWLLILGAVYIGVILFAPRGVLGALRSGR